MSVVRLGSATLTPRIYEDVRTRGYIKGRAPAEVTSFEDDFAHLV